MVHRRETKSVWATRQQLETGKYHSELLAPLLAEGWTVETWADSESGRRHFTLSRLIDLDDVAEAARAYLRDRYAGPAEALEERPER